MADYWSIFPSLQGGGAYL